MFDYRRVWRFFQERFMDCAISCIGNCNQQGINPTYFILQAVILRMMNDNDGQDDLDDDDGDDDDVETEEDDVEEDI